MRRRDALQLLSGALLVPAWAAEGGLRFGSLDHVEFYVSDLQKSLGLYARVFGKDLWKHNSVPRHYLKLGASYIAMEQGTPRIDHFCAGIRDYDVASLHDYLKQRGIAYRDYPSGRDLSVTDPDGIRMQLAADVTWKQLAGSTSPEAFPMSGATIFKPLGIDHILLRVSDPEASAVFYEKIFGSVSERRNGRTWFRAGTSRLGLLKTPEGKKPGLDHLCVSVPAFTYSAAVQQIEQAGGDIQTPEVAGSPEFLDADGFRVQIAPRV